MSLEWVLVGLSHDNDDDDDDDDDDDVFFEVGGRLRPLGCMLPIPI